MMIRVKGIINKYRENENFVTGNRKMLLIRQREWNKQTGNDKKQKRKEKTVHKAEEDHEN